MSTTTTDAVSKIEALIAYYELKIASQTRLAAEAHWTDIHRQHLEVRQVYIDVVRDLKLALRDVPVPVYLPIL